MNSIVKTYIKGLKNAYFDNKGQKDWEHFEKVISGATQENVAMLRQMYPEISDALIGLLEYVDGTYWRTYGETEITFFMLGSDVYEYPYYLLSSNEIIENKNQAQEYYADYIEERYEGIVIDEKITNEADKMNWLHFSNCMNNGGTSQLFIDYSPSEKGKKGQVIRFLHDPDEFKVIADSFEEYLKKLMDNTYNFIHEDSMEY
ncbi:SMI1/KNR4 family protein [Aquimarina hainanensis]|uniref:SMI1/KNR4 family protein n=1 Tax=Aquimarina hainanensis TaxID=1578017 RepID=A0ABW5NE03_9FLAO